MAQPARVRVQDHVGRQRAPPFRVPPQQLLEARDVGSLLRRRGGAGELRVAVQRGHAVDGSLVEQFRVVRHRRRRRQHQRSPGHGRGGHQGFEHYSNVVPAGRVALVENPLLRSSTRRARLLRRRHARPLGASHYLHKKRPASAAQNTRLLFLHSTTASLPLPQPRHTPWLAKRSAMSRGVSGRGWADPLPLSSPPTLASSSRG